MQSLELHSSRNIFFKHRIILFMGRKEYTLVEQNVTMDVVLLTQKSHPMRNLRSTYARGGEICFAPSYRTQSARVWCARYASQFELQLTRMIDVRFWGLSASQPISVAHADRLSYRRFTRRQATPVTTQPAVNI